MNVTFFNFAKRRNSTAQPTGGAAYDCILKESSSKLSPIIALKWHGGGAPRYNMAFIPAYGRYYWIDNWTYEDRCWIASLSVDVLASYKAEIGAANKYVLRSASEFDIAVADSLYPAKNSVDIKLTELNGIDFASTFAGGRFVVSVTSDVSFGGYTEAGANYYVMSSHQIPRLIDAAFTGTEQLWNVESLGSDVGTVFKNFGDKISKSITNPGQFINSIMWVPYVPITGSPAPVKLGTFSAGFDAYVLGNPISIFTFYASDIRPFPQQADVGYWKLDAPYVRYKLICPPFGSFDLPADIVRENAGAVNGFVKVDCISGQATLELTNYGIEAAAQLGIPIQLAGASVNYAAAAQAQANAISSPIKSLLSGDIIGAISGVPSGIISSMEAAAPSATQGAIGGGMAALNAMRYVYTAYRAPVEEDIAEQGRPLCKLKTLSSLSGFILCAEGDIVAAASPAELSEIATYLTGGFFYE